MRALLVLLLAGCMVYTPPADQSDVPERPRFEDQAKARGIDLVLGNATPGMPSMAGGVSVADVNGDGWDDVYLVADGPNHLFINEKGRFREATAEYGLEDDGNGRVALFFDQDGDGDQDLFLGNIQGDHRFFRNDGVFVDVSDRMGLIPSSVHGAAAADVDLDGDLDLLVANYFDWWLDGASYQVGREPQKNHLYRNDGDTFTEVGQEWGLTRGSNSLAASFADSDMDGDPDLMVANDFGGADEHWINEGDHFRLVSPQNGFFSVRDGMGVVWADFDNNGLQDSYISNIHQIIPGEPSDQSRQGNQMFFNNGTGFEWSNARHGVANALWSWGGVAIDADSDGDRDLYVANGFSDAITPHDPFTSPVEGVDQPNRFFENLHAQLWEPLFVERAAFWGLDHGYNGRGAAMLDVDRDGAPDLIHVSYGDPVLVLMNHAEHGNWLRLRLEGTTNNADAVGAVVHVTTPRGTSVEEVRAGHGYLSQNSKELHIGLGTAEAADVKVLWPGGKMQDVGRLAAGVHEIKET